MPNDCSWLNSVDFGNERKMETKRKKAMQGKRFLGFCAFWPDLLVSFVYWRSLEAKLFSGGQERLCSKYPIKVKQMQSVWICVLICRRFEEANLFTRKKERLCSKYQMQSVWICVLICRRLEEANLFTRKKERLCSKYPPPSPLGAKAAIAMW